MTMVLPGVTGRPARLHVVGDPAGSLCSPAGLRRARSMDRRVVLPDFQRPVRSVRLPLAMKPCQIQSRFDAVVVASSSSQRPCVSEQSFMVGFSARQKGAGGLENSCRGVHEKGAGGPIYSCRGACLGWPQETASKT